mgnify:CR=1 FL=1
MKACRRSGCPLVVWLVIVVAVAGLSSCARLPWRADAVGRFTFVQLCDPQLGMGGYEHDVASFERAVDRINRLGPDFVVLCGDTVHDADASSFADFKRIKGGLEVPCHVVPGNHDVGNEPSPESLQNYREVIGRDYDAIEHEGVVFVLVNTQLWKSPVDGESERQDAWLEATLEAAAEEGSPIFVVGHYPLFLESPDEEEEYMNLPAAKRRELLDLFERCGVVAVLGGHTHRLVVNDYRGMQLVNGETTSKNFDERPFGFRLWHVEGRGAYRHEFIALDEG